MAEQREFVHMFRTMGEQIQGLTTTVGAQGIAKVIQPFDGDCKQFIQWVKIIENYIVLVGMAADSIKLIFYQASCGPVKRYRDDSDNESDISLMELRKRLHARDKENNTPQSK